MRQFLKKFVLMDEILNLNLKSLLIIEKSLFVDDQKI